ncbi:MAG: esterase-like activity of phytase family protein [Bacteroidaceae bacterium]|nr:esterase-like activity of phytase family protein [Bacteroidaceae bacterium]
MAKRLIALLLAALPALLLAQRAELLEPVNLKKWKIAPGNYSGITPLGDDRYAVVSDKDTADGFHIWHIEMERSTGVITAVTDEGFFANPTPQRDWRGLSVRDCEGIAYHPTGSVFISGEGDQEILEYTLRGLPTGRRLDVPTIFAKANIVGNAGFEALCYDTATHRFWTTTETTLPADGQHATVRTPSVINVLRLQSFGDDLKPAAQYAYRMDIGRTRKDGTAYAFGVSALCPWGDGRFVVVEREVNVAKRYLGSEAATKIYLADPRAARAVSDTTDVQHLAPGDYVPKQLLASFTTKIAPFRVDWANYEGICPGPELEGGRRTFILINDSQNRAGTRLARLKDYLRVVVVYP